jgi:hypothetical protein
MDRTGFVTPSLSRGLAKDGFVTLEAQGARFASALRLMSLRPVTTKKGVRHGVSKFARLGEAAHLVQVIGTTPNERDASISQFVPSTHAVNHGPVRKQLHFYLWQTMFSARRGMEVGGDSGVVLEVEEHAVERLFQRLQTLVLKSVADELRDAMLLTLPLAEVARRLSLRQMALPTSNGLFLCHYSPESRVLLAKTWLPADGLRPRYRSVRSLIGEVTVKFGGEKEFARLLGAGMKRSIEDGDCSVIDSLVSALSNVRWLKDPYSPLPDSEGDIWKAAQRQADTANQER